MADRPASERTEPPTPERLRKAREEGKIPQSQEMPAALALGTLLLTLSLSGAALWRWFSRQVADGCAFDLARSFDAESAIQLIRDKGTEALAVLAPFMVAMSASAVFGSVVVSGWSIAPKATRIDPARINPANGLRNLVSTRSVVNLLASLAKLAIIGAIVVAYFRDKLGFCLSLVWASPLEGLKATMDGVFGVTSRIAAALLVIALLDALYQRWQHRRDMRMTRQEIKEERRQHEVSPEVRSRIRAVQFEMVRKRMLQAVPTADVVLANPTHVAVALKYDAAAMNAPQVVAKGADLLSEQIKEIARTHGVPIVQRPELARAIYNTCDPGDVVPEPLYIAVAEVLAMIYRLRRQHQAKPVGRDAP